jgi:tetratricopeptide (TPR) repeat protein
MAQKITKKDLTQPDAFQLALTRLQDYVSENKQKIYIGSGVIVLILLLSAGWYLYITYNEKNAQALYINAHLATLKSGPAEIPADPNAMKLYQEVITGYPGTNAALMAFYRLGNIYYRVNDIEASIKAYQEYLNGSPKDNELTVLVHIGLGYCYESKKDLKKALELFENAANTKASGNFESINYRNIARIHEELKNTEKSVEFYRKALEKASDPATELLIKRKILSLS